MVLDALMLLSITVGEKVLLDPADNDIGLSSNMSAEYCVKTFCGMLNTGKTNRLHFKKEKQIQLIFAKFDLVEYK